MILSVFYHCPQGPWTLRLSKLPSVVHQLKENRGRVVVRSVWKRLTLAVRSNQADRLRVKGFYLWAAGPRVWGERARMHRSNYRDSKYSRGLWPLHVTQYSAAFQPALKGLTFVLFIRQPAQSIWFFQQTNCTSNFIQDIWPGTVCNPVWPTDRRLTCHQFLHF